MIELIPRRAVAAAIVAAAIIASTPAQLAYARVVQAKRAAGRVRAHRAPIGASAADALARRMIATYKGATTIQETSEAKIALPGRPVYYQESIFKFRKPNLLVETSTDPIGGTLSAYCDGHEVTVYDAKQNIYTRRTAPADLHGTLQAISNAYAALIGSAPVQVLSPISFLSATGMPREASAFRVAGTQIVGGHKLVTLAAEMSLGWAQSFVGSTQAKLVKRGIQLTIDSSTGLLTRGALYLLFQLPVAGRKKHGTEPETGISFAEIHRGTRLNAPLPANAFTFTPPVGAQQMFHESR